MKLTFCQIQDMWLSMRLFDVILLRNYLAGHLIVTHTCVLGSCVSRTIGLLITWYYIRSTRRERIQVSLPTIEVLLSLPWSVKSLNTFVLEKIQSCLPKSQSSLQYGFTKGLSPLMAALVFSETIVESHEANQPLYLGFLDTQKAFDVVFHDSMKCKLFHQGVNLHIWNVIDNLYSSLTSKVFWNGSISFGISCLARCPCIPTYIKKQIWTV